MALWKLHWTFSGGDRLAWSAGAVHVSGEGAVAAALRLDLLFGAQGSGVRLTIHGADSVQLDTTSPWLVSGWCNGVALRHHETVITDYLSDGTDLPREVMEICALEPEPEGAIH